ncbi:hypothetical protein Natpe_2746 [Natrinema pellirubrum DSM 15624]|uniref:Uncharacterized protein n=1 Tax=Natrinema pellirubrum (strain DSM 15624 / CIP 106293 / JCM 10476 / NCIMB 786 / 157) TaxID=797303 RepID=L0JNX3_NATP1|nr:hypothetical protein [Natrinema pellirubrum]AGB32548.1 hypothetical protein Natpe_2746 [Natrinema pellirubrum DSM 15624]
MDGSELRRRELLAGASGGCVALAGCTDGLLGGSPGYGESYGRSYGGE